MGFQGFRVFGFRISDLGFRVQGLGWVWGAGFQGTVLGFWRQVHEEPRQPHRERGELGSSQHQTASPKNGIQNRDQEPYYTLNSKARV